MGNAEEHAGDQNPRKLKDGMERELGGDPNAAPPEGRWASWDVERDGFGVLLLMQHGGPRHAF